MKKRFLCFCESPQGFAVGVCRQKRSPARYLKISMCIYNLKYVWDILNYLRHILNYVPCIFNYLREIFYRAKKNIFFVRGAFLQNASFWLSTEPAFIYMELALKVPFYICFLCGKMISVRFVDSGFSLRNYCEWDFSVSFNIEETVWIYLS